MSARLVANDLPFSKLQCEKIVTVDGVKTVLYNLKNILSFMQAEFDIIFSNTGSRKKGKI